MKEVPTVLGINEESLNVNLFANDVIELEDFGFLLRLVWCLPGSQLICTLSPMPGLVPRVDIADACLVCLRVPCDHCLPFGFPSFSELSWHSGKALHTPADASALMMYTYQRVSVALLLHDIDSDPTSPWTAPVTIAALESIESQ